MRAKKAATSVRREVGEEESRSLKSVVRCFRQAQHDEESPEEKELQTENRPLPIETMEVHHHPEVEKKGFKEYLLEGLMIFLAVTMGFFAESLREHIGDNNREKVVFIPLLKT